MQPRLFHEPVILWLSLWDSTASSGAAAGCRSCRCHQDQGSINLVCFFCPVSSPRMSQSCVTLGQGEQLVPFSVFIKGLKAQFGAQMCSCLPSTHCSHFPSHHCHREQAMPRKSTKNIPGCSWQLLLPAQPHTRQTLLSLPVPPSTIPIPPNLEQHSGKAQLETSQENHTFHPSATS